jgi:hypothetical protein
MRTISITLLLAAGCSSGNGGGGGGDGSTSTPVAVCEDAAGNPITCPVPVSGTTCARGDATACTPLVRSELSVGQKTCLRLVIENRCGAETFSDTCIEHRQGDGQLTWQCWTSSTLAGYSIDVAQCDATGRWYHVASLSPGELDVIEQQGSCPMPM